MPSSHPCRPLTASSLVARPLTPGDFQRFGTVLQAPPRVNAARPINAGTALRFDLVDDMQLDAAGGRAQLALFSAQARSFPLVLHEMECHQLGSQTFVPLGARRFVIVVAAAGAPPEAAALEAFVTDGQQGVTLAPGTWHHSLLALDGGDFVVIERAAPSVDCVLSTLPTAVELSLAV